MTADDEAWFKIAQRIGCSPQEAKRKTTATQFFKWLELFDKELFDFNRSDYPIARVAYEVYELRATLAAIFGVRLPSRDINEFVPTFVRKEDEDNLSEEDLKARAMQKASESQSVYKALLGIDESGVVQDNRTPSEIVLARLLEKEAKEREIRPVVVQKVEEKQGESTPTPTPSMNVVRKALLQQVLQG